MSAAFCLHLQFGDKGKMYLVRFLNSCVMVRVGGGWEALPKFLESNDPCRGWFCLVHSVYSCIECVTVFQLSAAREGIIGNAIGTV